MNTNGWFIDDHAAARLAAVEGLHVHVSVDAASPEEHDATRGVPGSWRRAVQAIDLLLSHGVNVHVARVVTPSNVHDVPQFLDRMWLLGLPEARVTPVVTVGAAANGSWSIDRPSLEHVAAAFQAQRDPEFATVIRDADGVMEHAASKTPRSMLIRPNGAVLMDSLHPFAVADVHRQSLAECWPRVVRGWHDQRVERWRQAGTGAGPVAYRDADVEIEPEQGAASAAAPVTTAATPRVASRVVGRLKHEASARRARRTHLPDLLADDPARSFVLSLALARRYERGDARATLGTDGAERYVRAAATQAVHVLNATAGLVLDAAGGGTPGDAVDLLCARNPGLDRAQLELDVIAAVRWLVARGLLIPAPPPRSSRDSRDRPRSIARR
jgi:hypothetical protein